MGAKFYTLGLAGVLVIYLLLLGQSGFALLTSGEPLAMGLGLAVLVFPIFGLWIVYREIKFGTTAQEMTDAYTNEHPDLTEDALLSTIPDTPEAAQDRVTLDPDDWQAWFSAGISYSRSGDRRQARRAMYHAAHLFRTRETASQS